MPTKQAQLHKKIIEEWRFQYGNVCPGWNRPAHYVFKPNKLTVDHNNPQALNKGSDYIHTRENLSVLCRVCNSRKWKHI